MLAIIIPFYKLSYFESTLKSLSIQTDKRFKVYIGDDASPENISELLLNYKDKLKFNYHRFEKNLGGTSLTKQWKRCIALSGNEEWIMILGDDDVLGNNVVEEFYKHLDEVKASNIPVIRYATYKINDKGYYISQLNQHPKLENSIDFFFSKTRSSLSEYIFEKYQLLENDFVDLPCGWCADTLAILEISKFENIYSINDAVVFVRISAINISSDIALLQHKKEAAFLFIYTLLSKHKARFTKDQKNKLTVEIIGICLNEGKLINNFLNLPF